jgi:hypothetical protein
LLSVQRLLHRTATINAAIAIHGFGSNEHVTVASAWSLCGVEGVELITNGGFEGSFSPWVKSGTVLFFNNGPYPQSGTGYIDIGNDTSAIDSPGTAYQEITIPSTAQSANLSFWLNITSDETTTAEDDKLFVEVLDMAGNVKSIETYSNLDKSGSPTAKGIYSKKGGSFQFNLLEYKGQTIRVQFRTVANLVNPYGLTYFRIDNVSVQ